MEDSNSNIRVRTMYLRNRVEFPPAPSQRATRDCLREQRVGHDELVDRKRSCVPRIGRLA